MNLRILNKFHFAVLEENIEKFAEFIQRQILNERSSNSRNAMQLFWEMFKENADKTEDGRKTTKNW